MQALLKLEKLLSPQDKYAFPTIISLFCDVLAFISQKYMHFRIIRKTQKPIGLRSASQELQQYIKKDSDTFFRNVIRKNPQIFIDGKNYLFANFHDSSIFFFPEGMQFLKDLIQKFNNHDLTTYTILNLQHHPDNTIQIDLMIDELKRRIDISKQNAIEIFSTTIEKFDLIYSLINSKKSRWEFLEIYKSLGLKTPNSEFYFNQLIIKAMYDDYAFEILSYMFSCATDLKMYQIKSGQIFGDIFHSLRWNHKAKNFEKVIQLLLQNKFQFQNPMQEAKYRDWRFRTMSFWDIFLDTVTPQTACYCCVLDFIIQNQEECKSKIKYMSIDEMKKILQSANPKQSYQKEKILFFEKLTSDFFKDPFLKMIIENILWQSENFIHILNSASEQNISLLKYYYYHSDIPYIFLQKLDGLFESNPEIRRWFIRNIVDVQKSLHISSRRNDFYWTNPNTELMETHEFKFLIEHICNGFRNQNLMEVYKFVMDQISIQKEFQKLDLTNIGFIMYTFVDDVNLLKQMMEYYNEKQMQKYSESLFRN